MSLGNEDDNEYEMEERCKRLVLVLDNGEIASNQSLVV
jgi:hypothetical protein